MLLQRCRPATVIALSLLMSPATLADRPLREARSDNGRFILRIDRGRPGRSNARPCRGTLFDRGDKGGRKTVWQANLVNEISPEHAAVHDAGRWVVTLNDFGAGGTRHAVVIYDKDGTPAKTFTLKDLLTTDDWTHVELVKKELRWLPDDAKWTFQGGPERFIIKLPWDRIIEIDLEKLAVLNPPPADTPLPPEFAALLAQSADPEATDGVVPQVAELHADDQLIATLEAALASGEMSPEQAQAVEELLAQLRGEAPPETPVPPVDPATLERLAELPPIQDINGVQPPPPNPLELTDYVAWLNELSATDEPSAVPFLQEAVAQVVPFTGDEELLYAAQRGEAEALLNPEIQAWLDANARALELFRAATNYEYRGMPVESPDGTMIGVLLPDLSNLRQIAKIGNTEAQRQLLLGNTDAAVAITTDLIASGAQLGQGPTLIEQLVGVAVQNLATNTLLKATAADPDRFDLSRVAEELRAVNYGPRPLAETFQFERAMALDMMQRVYSYDEASGDFRVDPEKIAEINRSFELQVVPEEMTGDFTAVVSELNGFYDQLIAAAQQPAAVSAGQLPALEESVNQLNPLARELIPSLSRAMEISATVEANRRGAILATEVLAYRQRTGHLPTSLADLGPLGDDLREPFLGGDFYYHTDGDNFTLYAPGIDGLDDGGDSTNVNAGQGPRRLRDIVVWPPKRD